MKDYNKSIRNNPYKDKYIFDWIKSTLESIGCKIPGEKNNNDINENNIVENINNTNEIVKTARNIRSISSDINKKTINNSVIKRLNKKSPRIAKKDGNNSINNNIHNNEMEKNKILININNLKK